MLFYDWLLSTRAQLIMLQNGVEPARIDYNDNAFASNPKTIEVDERPIVAHYVSWSKKYAEILGVKG